MHRSPLTIVVAMAIAGFAPATTLAQTAPDPTVGGFSFADIHFSIGQKAWFTSWDTRLLDAAIVLPSPTSPPVVATSIGSRVVEHVLPITSLAARYGDFSLGGTVSPTVRYSDDLANTGSLTRSEFDVNVSYAITPFLNASLIYKAGRISQTTSASFTRLLQDSGSASLKGVLLGLNGAAPVGDGLTLYGTVAFGPGREHAHFHDEVRDRFNYSIGEVGLNYAPPIDALRSVRLSAGYRIQVISLKGLEAGTFSVTGVQLSSTRQDAVTTTHGPVAAISVFF